MDSWEDGILLDFTGAPVRGHSLEKPLGMPSDCQENYLRRIRIPIEGAAAGMNLRCYESAYKWKDGWKDVICLYDRWGHIIKQWPEGYIPNDEEIKEAVHEGLKKEGRRF